jgi:hypothetical protein
MQYSNFYYFSPQPTEKDEVWAAKYSNLVLNVFPPNNKESLFQDSERDVRHSTD